MPPRRAIAAHPVGFFIRGDDHAAARTKAGDALAYLHNAHNLRLAMILTLVLQVVFMPSIEIRHLAALIYAALDI